MKTSDNTWRIIGTSVIGTSHITIGRPCEDSHHYQYFTPQTLLLVAADGAGSAVNAKMGAESAVEGVTNAFRDVFDAGFPQTVAEWQTTLAKSVDAARHHIEVIAAQNPSVALDTYASTLLIAVVTPNWIAVAQLGDGAVVVQTMDGNLQMLTKPDHGEYINEAFFLTQADYRTHIQYAVAPSDSTCGVAVLTDGLQMLGIDMVRNTPYTPFFGPLFDLARTSLTTAELTAFLQGEKVCNRTDDDKTLILAVRQAHLHE